ncbi:putative 6-phosphofructo-2-kinase, Fructose-2,6-bisphosphate 2-phosphatase [Helianthus anomalus]
MEVIPDPPKLFHSPGLVDSKSVGTISPIQKQDSYKALYVDRGVGSPHLVTDTCFGLALHFTLSI